MSRVGYWRENWGVESITPHPISVFDDEELRRLERQYRKALRDIKPGRVPKPLLMSLFTPPHKRYPGQAWDEDKFYIERNKRGEMVLYRYRIGSKGKGKDWTLIGYEKLEPWEYGPPAPIYSKKVRVIGRPPVPPPKGSHRDKWQAYYQAAALWAWRYQPKTQYREMLKSARRFIKDWNTAATKAYEEAKQQQRKQVRIAKQRLEEWYLKEYRRIERSYSGDQYSGRIVRNPYGVKRR